MCLALSCWSIVPRTGCLGVSGLSRIRHTSTGLALSLCGHDHLDEVLPRSPPIGLAALERDRFAGRAPLAMAPVHHDPDVLLSLKGRSNRPLEIGMRLRDDDVHRPEAMSGPGVCAKDAHEDSGEGFDHSVVLSSNTPSLLSRRGWPLRQMPPLADGFQSGKGPHHHGAVTAASQPGLFGNVEDIVRNLAYCSRYMTKAWEVIDVDHDRTVTRGDYVQAIDIQPEDLANAQCQSFPL